MKGPATNSFRLVTWGGTQPPGGLRQLAWEETRAEVGFHRMIEIVSSGKDSFPIQTPVVTLRRLAPSLGLCLFPAHFHG